MKYRYESGDTVYEVLLERHGDTYRVTVNGEPYDLEVLDAQPGALSFRFRQLGGPVEPDAAIRPRVVYWGADPLPADHDAKWLSYGGCTYRLDRPKEHQRGPAGGSRVEDALRSQRARSERVRAPMPAQVRALQVAEGDAVEAGQTLLLLEAMKMEIKLSSPRAGRVSRILARPGDTVDRDQVLVEMDL